MNQLMLLSDGSNSKIYSYGQGKEQVILKVVSASNRKEQKHLKNQFEILQSLHHKNVVKSLRYRQNVVFPGNKTDKQLKKSPTNNILVLEHASKGSLLNYLRKQNPEMSDKRRAFKSVVQGIAYLHSSGIAHRDLKLQNILVFAQNGIQSFKISDFGFASCFLQNGEIFKFKDYKGTKKGYMAPQIHQCSKNNQKEYDAAKADIFALGVILFSLVFGHFPFEYAMSSNAHYKHILQKQFTTFWSYHNVQKFQLLKGFRLKEVKSLFEKMVSYEPESRPSIEQVLQHDWLSEQLFNKI